MSLLPKTQDHLDVIDVRDNILILTGGRFRLVIEATAINFDLLSEEEQNATIYAYANLVNSIDYPIQILIRTRQVDITSYIKFLESQIHEQVAGAMREQLQDYIDFVKQLVMENTVLQKKFFVVIPYGTLELRAQKSSLPFGGSNSPQTNYSIQALKKAKVELEQKMEELKWQFNRLGIKIRQLNTEELIRLFYEVYNPEAGQNMGMNQDLYGYTTKMVDSSIKPPTAKQ